MNGATQVATLNSASTSEQAHAQAPNEHPTPRPTDNVVEKAKLPSPKPSPPEVEQPKEWEEFLKTKPSKQQVRAWEKQDEDYKAFESHKGAIESVEKLASDDQRVVEELFLDGQQYKSKYEAAEGIVDQLVEIVETNADNAKRLKALSNLRTLCTRWPEVKAIYDLNEKLILEWAKGKFSEERPKMRYTENNGTTLPKAEDDDPWKNGRGRRDEMPPEQHQFEPHNNEFTASIRAAWEEGDPLLVDMMYQPEQIRGDNAERILRINEKINQLKEDNIEGDKSECPDLQIPAGLIIRVLVASVESSIVRGVTSIDNDPQARQFFKEASAYVDRANAYVDGAEHPNRWLKNIHEAYTKHLKTARDNKVTSLDAMEAAPFLWQKDLKPWILHQMGSGDMTQEVGPEWKDPMDLDEPPKVSESQSVPEGQAARDTDQDQQSAPAMQATPPLGTQDTSKGEAAGDLNQGQGDLNQGQSDVNQGQSARPASQETPTSKDWVTTRYYQGKDGKSRHVGGLRKQGHGYQMLLRMNDETEKIAFWELTGGIAKRADSDVWISKHGPLIGAYDRSLTKGIRNYRATELNITGIAVQPRKTGESYVNRGITLIQGWFSNERFGGKENPLTEEHEHFARPRFYIISALREALGEEAIEDLYTNLMRDNGFRRPANPRGTRLGGQPSRERTKRMMQNRRKALRDARNDASEDSEDITQEDIKPVGENGGKHTYESDGFVVPNSADEPEQLTFDVMSRRLDEKLDERLNKRLADFQTEFRDILAKDVVEQVKSMQQSLEATIQASIGASMQTFAQQNRPVAQQ